MADEHRRAAYLARVRALHDGGRRVVKKTTKTAGKNDNDLSFGELLAELERLDVKDVVRIIVAGRDDTVNFQQWIDKLIALRAEKRGAPVEQAERDRWQFDYREELRRALASDDFWSRWVRECFPRVTRLPAGSDTWRLLAQRIVKLVCTARFAAMREGLEPHEDFDAKPCFAPLVAWPDFRAAVKAAATCSQLFSREYTTVKTELGEDYYAHEVNFGIIIDSENYRTRGVELSSWYTDIRYFLSDDPSYRTAPNGFYGKVWERRKDRKLAFMAFTTYMSPSWFVSDQLFAAIARHSFVGPTAATAAQTNKLLEQLFLTTI